MPTSTVLIPNRIPQSYITEAKTYFDNGQYAEAWNTLAQGGDRYADNAAGVLGRNDDSADYFFQKLVQHFWDSNDPGAYERSFNNVAHDHLENYLKQLEKGYLPDTQFIISSYEESLVKNGLSPNLAFDGAWSKAVPGDSKFDATWGIPFLGMEADRMTTSQPNNTLSSLEAGVLIGHALVEAEWDILKAGLDAQLYLDFSKRFGQGVADYFGDLLGNLLDFLIPPAYGDDINPLENDLYKAARVYRVPVRRDPLTLDLDGDGLETTPFNAANPVFFDHDLNGIKEGTGWVGADDGFLVYDRNGNNVIDNGSELFGDHTPKSGGGYTADGFAALAQEDTNRDGKVDTNDAHFANLRVWRDLNQNGLSESIELFTLAQLGITGINVGSTENNQILSNGNQIADLGTFTKIDGSSGTVGEVSGNLADINLVADTFHREFADQLDTSSVANLPDVQGSGAVRDLREAATLSPQLASLITNFAAQSTREGQRA